MIKPNELRIGNWIECDNQFRQVDQIGSGLISLTPDSKFTIEVSQNSEVNPIPLTHEILKKARFEYFKSAPFLDYNYSECFIIKKGNENKIVILFDGKIYFYINYGSSFKTNIQSVHQLQNLYFALTGEELEIKF